METKVCDVCIVGAGSAGMAAAYALKGRGYKVVLVEKYPQLGGTAVNAWVETWIMGINPPYLIEIFNLLKNAGTAWGDLDKSWLPAKFAKPKYLDDKGNASFLRFEPAALAGKYRADLNADTNFIVLSEFQLTKVIRNGRNITSIEVANSSSKETCQITAKYFIDSSGDGVLCREAGCQAFLGEDSYKDYQEDLMNGKTPKKILNEPSLLFKIKPSSGDIPKNKMQNNFTYDGYIDWHWINPMAGFGISGMEVIDKGIEPTYTKAVSLRTDFWAFIRQEYTRRIENNERPYGYSDKVLTTIPSGEYAPMLGIRESYRIECDYMLRQSDLTDKIHSDSAYLKEKKFIACGCHDDVDFHVYGSLSRQEVKAFDKNYLQPSGIPYDCIIPKVLDNTLIACRAYGATHIALAARRINKDMAQLGWAAGHAVRFCLEKKLSDTRKADVKILQSAEYTGFVDSVKEVEKRMK
jgi:hypothetical protein